MRYYSTRDRGAAVNFADAALTGLAPDGGLYAPGEIPRLRAAVISSLGTMSYPEIAFETIAPWVTPDIPAAALRDMVESAYSFGAPLVPVGGRAVLELFHGPTAAFKDFGARFMARAFAYLRRGETKPLTILVATSGDTGGAVADGFYGVEGVRVTVLYPKGRVSPLQERQIAGLGGNVTALAVEGGFDDCQRLVKAAFRDRGITGRLALSSANSINVARLIPQAAYHAAAAGRAAAGRFDPDGEATPRAAPRLPSPWPSRPPVICVPSGNFGNLTAGLYARAMGAPIAGFIAATNVNRAVPDYLETGRYEPRESVATLSNAMDVGAPSNFERMTAMYSLDALRSLIRGAAVTDAETRETMDAVAARWGYELDPHTAVGWRAADAAGKTAGKAGGGAGGGSTVILATAHPAKFGRPAPVPPSLRAVVDRTPRAAVIPPDLEALRAALGA